MSSYYITRCARKHDIQSLDIETKRKETSPLVISISMSTRNTLKTDPLCLIHISYWLAGGLGLNGCRCRPGPVLIHFLINMIQHEIQMVAIRSLLEGEERIAGRLCFPMSIYFRFFHSHVTQIPYRAQTRRKDW